MAARPAPTRRLATSLTAACSAVLLSLSVLLLTAPMATAVPSGSGATNPVPASDLTAGPVALAHTGLDITGPLLVGFAVLLVGTALVGWAVLRGSRGGSAHG